MLHLHDVIRYNRVKKFQSNKKKFSLFDTFVYELLYNSLCTSNIIQIGINIPIKLEHKVYRRVIDLNAL